MSPVIKLTAQPDIKETIRQAVEGFGGFGKFVGAGESVLIKPNYNTADPPPASTDPAFLVAVAELLHEHGAGAVTIGESSTFYDNTKMDLQRTGVFALAETRPWLRVIVFDEGKWVKRKIPGGKHLKSVHVPAEIERHDRLIYVCCLKTHCHARFTGSLKLSVGFMKPKERISLHLGNLQPKIAELASLFSPDLIIMDARKCFITRGPNRGEVREPGLVLASTDRVTLDIEGIRVIQQFPGNDLAGLDPETLPQIVRAREMGL